MWLNIIACLALLVASSWPASQQRTEAWVLAPPNSAQTKSLKLRLSLEYYTRSASGVFYEDEARTVLASFSIKVRVSLEIRPRTSCTLSENHTTRLIFQLIARATSHRPSTAVADSSCSSAGMGASSLTQSAVIVRALSLWILHACKYKNTHPSWRSNPLPHSKGFAFC